MKINTLKVIAASIATVGVMAVTTQQAQAGTIHNGWNYSMDSFRDGTEGGTIGKNSAFEFYGMAFQETADSFVFAFNSNLAFDPSNPSSNGYAANGAMGNSVTYGDLFLNFTDPQSINAAEGSLYAVRFDASNDTNGQYSVGLYKNVTTASYTTQNWGYGTVQSHTNTVNNNLGGQAGYGDMAASTTYFNQNQAAQTAIGSGTRLGNIDFLSSSMLSGMGLNFGASAINATGETGSQTFGFKLSKSLFGGQLPKGSFVASLFAECGNDGMVLSGSTASTPEPSAMLGFAAVGLMVGTTQIKRRRSVKLEA
jgi:hypothetical protein